MTLNKKDTLLEQYPVGTRIVLTEMAKDPWPVEPGSKGTVTGADSMGNLYMAWDNGRTLSLCPDVDIFEIITQPEAEAEKDD